MYGRALKQEDLQFLELLEYFSTGIPSLRGVNPPKIILVRDFWQRASMYPNVYGCNSHSNRVVVMIFNSTWTKRPEGGRCIGVRIMLRRAKT